MADDFACGPYCPKSDHGSEPKHDPKIGIGGAPTRATTLPTTGTERKHYPVANGVLDYFPDAIVAIAHVSWQGNNQHHPGQPLHWAREKSTDEADTMIRHFLERGSRDVDGIRHTAKMAWRALALLQKEIEAEKGGLVSPLFVGEDPAAGNQAHLRGRIETRKTVARFRWPPRSKRKNR